MHTLEKCSTSYLDFGALDCGMEFHVGVVVFVAEFTFAVVHGESVEKFVVGCRVIYVHIEVLG